MTQPRSSAGQFKPLHEPQISDEVLDKGRTLADAEQAVLAGVAALRKRLVAEVAYLETLSTREAREECAGRISTMSRELTHVIRALKTHGVPIEVPPEENAFDRAERLFNEGKRRAERRARRAARLAAKAGDPAAVTPPPPEAQGDQTISEEATE